MTGEELMVLAARVDEQWLDDPNVIGVGFGIKERAGQWVEGECLCFTVRRKFVTEEEIRAAGSRPIPAEIEGVLTDVNVVEAVPTGQFPTGSRGTRIEEPLKGGVSTSVLGSFISFPSEGYGTLGALCIHNPTGKQMALSNAHVWGDDIGNDITQPFLPVDEYIEAVVKLLACGPIISYIAEGTLPSGLTAVLTAAAGAAWVAAAASDAKDPHRRGQEATIPAQPNERTVTKSVRFAAEPQEPPLPGKPFQADVDWEYTRQTDQGTYPFAVNETRVNEHVLVRQQLWTDQPQYAAGRVVEIMALLETTGVERPDAFHVVAHLASDKQPERRISRILQPSKCDRAPSFCVNFNQREPNTEVQFPLEEQGLIFRSNHAGIFRGVPGQVRLQFPRQGMEIAIPPSESAEALVIAFHPEPIILEAYDAGNTKLDEASTPGNLLVVQSSSRERPITRLVLRGGGSEGQLIQVCLTLLRPPVLELSSSENRIFCYKGRYTLDPSEPQSSWSGLLSAQTVNTVPPGTPPEEAATTIGGLESATIANIGAACVIILALDKLFDVI
jgi:hypothetical protein